KAVLKQSIAVKLADRTHDVTSFLLALSGLSEVRERIATDLCTAEASHLLEPFIRFHDRVTGAPRAITSTVDLLRYHHAGRSTEATGDLLEAELHYRKALEVRPDHLPTLAACARVLAEAERWDAHVDMLGTMANVVVDRGQKIATLLLAAS